MSDPAQTRSWHRSEKLRFLAVGAWNTLFGYAAFASLYMLLHARIHYLLISIMSHFAAVTNAFLCQRFLVFHARPGGWAAFLRFNLVQLVMLCWGLAGLAFLAGVLHLSPLLSQLIVIAVAAASGYLLHRSFTFRR